MIPFLIHKNHRATIRRVYILPDGYTKVEFEVSWEGWSDGKRFAKPLGCFGDKEQAINAVRALGFRQYRINKRPSWNGSNKFDHYDIKDHYDPETGVDWLSIYMEKVCETYLY